MSYLGRPYPLGVFAVVAIAYSAIAVGVNNLMLQWYTNASVNLNQSRINTAAIVVQRENGYNYWQAYLTNYGGLGGIRVGNPITLEKAVELVKVNNSGVNVFTIEFGRAVAAVLTAYSYGYAGP